MNGSKNEGLQVARAVAALSVAYFHSYISQRGFSEAASHPIPLLRDWGFLGVNFFFAISGYVICLVVEKKSFSLRGFVIKRAFRLYPMYWSVLAIVAVMIPFGKYEPQSILHFLYSATLLPQQGPPTYDFSWTLEREVIFYALAAIAIPVAGPIGLAGMLAVLAYIGLHYDNPWSFHLASTQQADFLSGVIAYIIGRRWQPGRWLSLSSIAFGATALWFTRSHEFAFAPTICLWLVLFGMINMQAPWQSRPFRWLIAAGNASYSIYLLHYLVFFWSYWLSASPRLALPGWLSEPWRFGSILACCLISQLTWRYIEKPFIRLGNRLAARQEAGPEMYGKLVPDQRSIETQV
jgi:peptidoglycan/LPS O-acetylase OafA/YrhL